MDFSGERGLDGSAPLHGGRTDALRRRLGIPDDAGRVLLLAESSHWDPNWLLTSEEYFERFVRRNLDQAIEELRREPRRVYSVECVFFLRMYWERQPEHQEAVRSLVNERRLRMTSSGVTTADTLLPGAEAILRDLLLGQEWLRANGMTQEPRVAYFTDSFGCSPGLPSLLNAAGFDRTAITRIDGMFFPGCDYEPKRHFPRPGSSAALLMNEGRTLDFVWRDPGGGEVLCHWNAFTYGQGDLLASRGLSRMYLFPVAFPDRSERNVARHIARYVAQLAPYSRTPYMFCPIGFDFVEPIPDLVALLDRYNRVRYPATGVWAVNAGLDDYLALVDGYRDRLPVLELDPNPYWTGFYTARPTLKKQCHELVRQLLRVEAQIANRGNRQIEEIGKSGTSANRESWAAKLEDAWWSAVVANHHDFITGTSPDRVVEEEQRPWLERAAASVQAVAAALPPLLQAPVLGGVPPAPGEGRIERPRWHSQGGRIVVQTPYYAVELAEEAGGGIVRAWHPDTEEPLLAGVSNDLISYQDGGGLWRMGYEFRGGRWKEEARASDWPARLQVVEHDEGLEVGVGLDGGNPRSGDPWFQDIRRWLWFRSDCPLIQFRVQGHAAERRTVTVRFATGVSAGRMVMDQPGTAVVRPLRKHYAPTFWPFQWFVRVLGDAGTREVTFRTAFPGAVSCWPDGRLELVALRNATRERAFGLVPFPAMPTPGHERAVYAFDYALSFARGDWREDEVPGWAVDSPWGAAGPDLDHEPGGGIVIGCPGVGVMAVKPASRGEGIIVRLCTFRTAVADVPIAVKGWSIREAFLCDARERDIQPLEVRDGVAHLAMPGPIATVRLLGE